MNARSSAFPAAIRSRQARTASLAETSPPRSRDRSSVRLNWLNSCIGSLPLLAALAPLPAALAMLRIRYPDPSGISVLWVQRFLGHDCDSRGIGRGDHLF